MNLAITTTAEGHFKLDCSSEEEEPENWIAFSEIANFSITATNWECHRWGQWQDKKATSRVSVRVKFVCLRLQNWQQGSILKLAEETSI